ncbi:hypothetical protein [Roseiflexus castenholzii]|uniref:hypothetical protein n=1 Tax=Roseiflexus castenholzii TaxID=120962 RepID=UPI003C7CC2FC
MLAYARKAYEQVKNAAPFKIYHRPLMLVLVNSVNTERSDLKLFFQALERIACEEVSKDMWESAKNELREELNQSLTFIFENANVEFKPEDWDNLSPEDMLRYVFNAEARGEIEVLIRSSDRKELAFKLKTSDHPFALIKIGDISGWLKEELSDYEIAERVEEESYFARLNKDGSDITILMGSRAFYEGWDSNRPNVITYINIGTDADAKKFILQSVGRGVRIEPIPNKRKRLLPLYNAGEVDGGLFNQLKDKVQPLETLFIFGTNREALETVIKGLEQEKVQADEQKLGLFEVNPEVKKRKLLIPVYKSSAQPVAAVRPIAKFEIDQGEFELLKQFVEATDDRVLLALTERNPRSLALLRQRLQQPDDFYRYNGRRFGDIRRLLNRVLDYLSVVPEEVDRLKELADEIRHFRHITVTLEDISKVKGNVVGRDEITLDEYTKGIEQVAGMVREERFEYNGQRIVIKHIAHHYYLPVVLAEDEKVDYIRHIIKTPSEVRFIKDLEACLEKGDNKFTEFDWWFFSKLDESLDEVYIPYYDQKTNRIARFKPDFIFWLAKESRYFIVFVDPKGTEHTEYQRKVDGYRVVFMENGMAKEFQYDNCKVSVHLFLYTQNQATIPQGYQECWVDTPAQLLEKLPNEEYGDGV